LEDAENQVYKTIHPCMLKKNILPHPWKDAVYVRRSFPHDVYLELAAHKNYLLPEQIKWKQKKIHPCMLQKNNLPYPWKDAVCARRYFPHDVYLKLCNTKIK